MAVGMVQQRANAQPNARARQGWIGRTARALAFGVSGVDTVVVALAGFLPRGGIVLLLLPSVVLPSVIGVASVTGLNAISIDGRPTTSLYVATLLVCVLVVLWLVVAFAVGSLVDVWLIEAALDDDGPATSGPRPLPELTVLLDLAAIRSLCILPLAGALIWAGSRVYSAAYTELTTPANLATPLVLRVILDVADAALVVVLAWLVSEVVGAIAVRRLILFEHSVWRSIGGAIVQIGRRPITSIGTVVVSFGASLIAAVLAMAATATTFDWCQVAARNQTPLPITIGGAQAIGDARPLVFILAGIALGVAWVVALAVSGIASAWRSAAFTGETAAAAPEARMGPVETRLGLSGTAPERSGD
jgi:hypothetical protein